MMMRCAELWQAAVVVAVLWTMPWLVSSAYGDDNASIRAAMGVVNVKSVFGADPARTAQENHTAIQAALDWANTVGGARLFLPAGSYDVSGGLVIYDNVELYGEGQDNTEINYTGSSLVDVKSVDSGDSTGIKIVGLTLRGPFQSSKARYGFHAENFQRNCVLRDLRIRDCLGALKIENGHYASFFNLQVQRMTPKQTLAGVNNTQWAEVYGSTSAPFYFHGNHATFEQMDIDTLVSENDDGGAAPEQAIWLDGQAISWMGVATESIGTPVTVGAGTANPTVRDLYSIRGNVQMISPYMESVQVGFRLFHSVNTLCL